MVERKIIKETPIIVEYRLTKHGMYIKDLIKHIVEWGLKHRAELEKIQKEIAKQKQRLKNGKDLMLDGEITSCEYKEMKHEIEEQIEKLNAEESKLRQGIENHNGLIDDSDKIIKNSMPYFGICFNPDRQYYPCAFCFDDKSVNQLKRLFSNP